MENPSLRAIAPLLDSYLSYLESPHLPFTIPGHKQRAGQLDADLGRVVDRDVPLFGGLDEIKLSKGLLQKAERLAADFWGGAWARFSTGGSTHANQALVFALGKPGDKVALSRNSHRSLLTALVLAGLEPIWLSPEIDSKTGVPTGVSLQELERALVKKPIALLLTEPGYLGTLSDLPPLIKLAHKNGIPVIVDAAWGGHFGFHPSMPPHPLQLGADAFVTSIHKALPGYSASALAVANLHLLDLAKLEQGFDSTHTTSPAGAPLASIDGVRALLQIRGPELLTCLLNNIAELRETLTNEFGEDILLKSADFALNRFDPTKLVLRANVLGADGIALENDLIDAGIRVEMADRDTVVFLATIADDSSAFDSLLTSLVPILGGHASTPRESGTALSWSITPKAGISMREAFFARSEFVHAEEAVGRFSSDLVAPYPPGVAVLAPGEVITREIVDGLKEARNAGIRIAYASDPTLETFRVVTK
jgi:lysine decarboxylase